MSDPWALNRILTVLSRQPNCPPVELSLLLGVQHVLGPCRQYDYLVGGLLVLVVIQRHPLDFLDLARDSGTAGLVAVAQPSILCRDFTVPWTLDSIIFSKVLMLRNICVEAIYGNSWSVMPRAAKNTTYC